MSISKQEIETALCEVVDPNMETDLMATGSVKDIGIDGASTQQ